MTLFSAFAYDSIIGIPSKIPLILSVVTTSLSLISLSRTGKHILDNRYDALREKHYQKTDRGVKDGFFAG